MGWRAIVDKLTWRHVLVNAAGELFGKLFEGLDIWIMLVPTPNVEHYCLKLLRWSFPSAKLHVRYWRDSERRVFASKFTCACFNMVFQGSFREREKRYISYQWSRDDNHVYHNL
jgi:hypothetical protein